jgi:hypothetical protein
MSKNIIRLTESELKTMIKEAVNKIITESPLYRKPVAREDYINVELMDLEFSNLQLDEFFAEAECPPVVKVKVKYTIEPIDRGDYWTPSSGGGIEKQDIEVDYDGTFKNIVPEDLYQIFISDIQSYVNKHWDGYSHGYDEY